MNSNNNISGYVAPGWESVRSAFEQNFIDGLDIGASVSVYYKGECVIDLYGGWKDPQTKQQPYSPGTLQLVYSASKGVTAAAVALCVDKGWLDYDAPVAKYWPEFAANGKQNVTVGDLLSHRAGLPCVDEQLTIDDLCDWSRMTSLLAAQKPYWEPGTTHGYHAYTHGFLGGELVRRVDPKHRTLGEFIRDELDSEFYVGVPNDEVEARVAPLITKEINTDMTAFSSMEPLTEKAATLNGIIPLQPLDSGDKIMNETRMHQAQIPAANGITNARSLARIYAQLIGDINENGKHKKRLISEKTLNQAIQNVTPPGEPDRILFGLPTSITRSGFMSHGILLTVLGDGVFGHLGKGGSCGLAYPPQQLAYAHVCNHIDASVLPISPRSVRLIEAIQGVLLQNTKTI